jgi:hypothetical protein
MQVRQEEARWLDQTIDKALRKMVIQYRILKLLIFISCLLKVLFLCPEKQREASQPQFNIEEHTQNCPPGLYRLFISRPVQTHFNIKTDEDITQEDNMRTLSKQVILDDLQLKMGISDFAPLKKQFEEYPEDEIIIIYDYEFQYDKNFYVCLSTELKDIIKNVKF